MTPDLRHRLFGTALQAWICAVIFAALAESPCPCSHCRGGLGPLLGF